VLVQVDLSLEPGQRLLDFVVGLGRLAELALFACEWVEAAVDSAVRAAGQLLDVSADAALSDSLIQLV
jgi:cyclopropane fatty-acyl-phospholipid synthase-like methyltransferase